MQIFLFNGPPRSGKDAAARHLYEALDFSTCCTILDRLSMPIKRAFAGTVNSYCDEFGEVEYFENNKEEVIDFLGISYRQWQINFSEKYMKPLYGQDILTRLFINRNADYMQGKTRGAILVPDCGFDIEAQALAEAYPGRVHLIRLYRAGCNFIGDSRTHIDPKPISKLASFSVINNTELSYFLVQIESRVRELMKEFEP